MDEILKFPIIKDSPPPPVLSMDQYWEFIQFNLSHVSDFQVLQEKRQEEKKFLNHVPFVIGDIKK